MSEPAPSEFEKAAPDREGGSLPADLWHFLRHTGKWWLMPVLLFLLLIGLLFVLTQTAAAPFIYTLF